MCGIVCYYGNKKAKEEILEGLYNLEYRGYDSSGIALLDSEINVYKKAGKLAELDNYLKEVKLMQNIGIGHIRWATHGISDDLNAHPQVSNSKKIAIVHNGIIENYQELKKELLAQGYYFKSDTDTEVLVNLIENYFSGDILKALSKALKRIKGSYAIGLIMTGEKERMLLARNKSPLVLAYRDKEILASSDILSIAEKVDKVIYLEDQQIVDIKDGVFKIYDLDLNSVKLNIEDVKVDKQVNDKLHFKHYMLKEIHEQAERVKDLTDIYIKDGKIDLKLNLDITKINKIFIVACGSAYNAALLAREYFIKYLKYDTEIKLASEFINEDNLIDAKTLVILVSQSGETADTLAVLKYIKQFNAISLALANVKESSLVRESDYYFLSHAGSEIAVASTKAYLCQVIALRLLALFLARLRFSDFAYEGIIKELSGLSNLIRVILNDAEKIKALAKDYLKDKDLFFLGKANDYYLAMEASLKLKEISYIHCEAFASGELKHGSIALIEKDVPVIIFNTIDKLKQKALSSASEVKARGANVLMISDDLSSEFNTYLLPKSSEDLKIISAIIFAQLFAYYVADLKGLDVDKPRNLAKSVTVE